MDGSTTKTTRQFTACASLSAIGVKLRQLDLFGPIHQYVEIAQKTVGNEFRIGFLYFEPIVAQSIETNLYFEDTCNCELPEYLTHKVMIRISKEM